VRDVKKIEVTHCCLLLTVSGPSLNYGLEARPQVSSGMPSLLIDGLPFIG
jgi:hypothetical protein